MTENRILEVSQDGKSVAIFRRTHKINSSTVDLIDKPFDKASKALNWWNS